MTVYEHYLGDHMYAELDDRFIDDITIYYSQDHFTKTKETVVSKSGLEEALTFFNKAMKKD